MGLLERGTQFVSSGFWVDIEENVVKTGGYAIPIDYVPALGGRLPRFLCLECGKRCEKIYWWKGPRCRKCAGLSYRSQSEGTYDRLIRRVRRVRRRLGGDSNLLANTPARPKRMHWRTYANFLGRLAAEEARVWGRLSARLEAGRRK